MASGASNQDNVPELLKSIWEDDVFDFQYEDEVFYGKVDKDTTFEGDGRYVTVKIGSGGGHSALFDKAQENRGPSTYRRMFVEVADNYAVWSVDKKFISLSRNQKGSLKRALQEATESAQTKLKRRTVRQLWGTGGGAIGKVSSISTTDLTLSNTADVRNFDIGDVCAFSNDDGYTASTGVLSGTRQVTAINEDTGVITFDTTLATIEGLGANDYVFIDGDYGAVMKGVLAYITTSAPGVSSIPTSIWGMTRTEFPTRLSGHRFTGDQNQIAEEVLIALTKAFKRNIKTTDIFMDPDLFNEFVMSLEGQRQRPASEKVGGVGYSGIEVTAQNGKTVKVWGDPSIPLSPSGNRLVFGLNMDTWVMASSEEYPMWLTDKGERFMVETSANAVQGRVGGYPQCYCDAPGQNWILELS